MSFRPKMNDFERGFIVGLIEGEGTITLYAHAFKQKQRVKNGKTYQYPAFTIHPKIIIANTNKELIFKAYKILGSGAVYERARKGRKPLYLLDVHGISTVFKILAEIKNDLIGKKKQAELVLEFCKSRSIAKGDKITSKKTPYHKKDFEFLRQIRLLNVPKAGKFSKKVNLAISERVELLGRGYFSFQSEKHAHRRVERICLWCGKTFTISPYTSKLRDSGVFCSKNCLGKAWRARQLGLPIEEAKRKWS